MSDTPISDEVVEQGTPAFEFPDIKLERPVPRRQVESVSMLDELTPQKIAEFFAKTIVKA